MESEKKLEILVIEDKQNHQEDVKRMLEQRQKAGANINVNYVSTLEEAYAKMPEADAVISDVFFPKQEGEAPVMQAYKMKEKAEELGKSLVFCTDGDHHGPHLQELTSNGFLGGNKRGYLGMVDFAIQHPQRTQEVLEARMKNWPDAYRKMMEVIDPKEAGDFTAHVESLGINTDEMFDSYWGPNFADLEKLLRDNSEKKPVQEIKMLWGHYMIDQPRFKRDLEIDYMEMLQSHNVQLTYTSSREEFMDLAKNGDFDIAVTDTYWGSQSLENEEESETGLILLKAARLYIPKTILMMDRPDQEIEADAKSKGIYCTSFRPTPKRMEKVLFEE